MKKRGPFEVVSSKQVYKNQWIEVVEDKVIRPDGKDGIFGIVTMVPGISILPIDKEGNVHLVKVYRYGIDKEIIETPTGAIDQGEEVLTAAKRELQEETGLTSEKWTPLGMVNPFTTVVVSPAFLFLAENVIEIEKPKDQEVIEVVTVPFSDVVQWALESKITHAQSVALILRAKEYLEKNK